MSQIILLAETGSDIPADLAKKEGIELVPMHVSFGQTTKNDGSFPPSEVVSFYKETGILPKTSGSVPEDFTTVFDRIHAAHPDAQILYLAYSAVTTCSYHNNIYYIQKLPGLTTRQFFVSLITQSQDCFISTSFFVGLTVPFG